MRMALLGARTQPHYPRSRTANRCHTPAPPKSVRRALYSSKEAPRPLSSWEAASELSSRIERGDVFSRAKAQGARWENVERRETRVIFEFMAPPT